MSRCRRTSSSWRRRRSCGCSTRRWGGGGGGAPRCKERLLLTKRGGRPLALVMADADDFKSCNDSRGHQYGDQVLRELARTLKASCRGSDVVGRMGGDEFLIILPDTSLTGALQFCRRVSKRIAEGKGERGGCSAPRAAPGFGGGA